MHPPKKSLKKKIKKMEDMKDLITATLTEIKTSHPTDHRTAFELLLVYSKTFLTTHQTQNIVTLRKQTI